MDFYNNKKVVDEFLFHRNKTDDPISAIEEVVIHDLINKFEGNVLDLGCGFGDNSSFYINKGFSHYYGIDSSEVMLDLAKKNNSNFKQMTFINCNITEFDYPTEKFDLIISRMTLHYIDLIGEVFNLIHRSLKHGGQFIFSVEHPIVTSSLDLPRSSLPKSFWKVDNYHHSGERKHKWLGSEVTKYHRKLEDYWSYLMTSNFKVESIKEGNPTEENFHSKEEYIRRKRTPLFLIISARKEQM